MAVIPPQVVAAAKYEARVAREEEAKLRALFVRPRWRDRAASALRRLADRLAG